MEKHNHESSDLSPHLDSFHSFLQELIGREVQVYKGGPESKKGKLLDVQADYITLYAENNVIYYRTEHLQSISENSKANAMPRFHNQEEDEVCFQTGEDFFDLVDSLVDCYIQINQGGPESKKGYLLDLSANYMALLTEDDGVVYYNIQHIKSISELNDSNEEEEVNESGEAEDEEESSELEVPDYIVADNFHQLFGQMSHQWVSINRGGPQALEGVLVQGDGNHYTLINGDDVLRINPFHIKSISCGPKGVMKNNNNSNYETTAECDNNSTNKQDSACESSSSNQQESCLTSSSSKHRSSSSRRRSSSSRHRSSSSKHRSSSSRRRSSSSSRRSSSSRHRSSSSKHRSSSSSRRSSGSRRRSSGSRRRSSGSRQRRRSPNHEVILKTMDYIWKPK